MQSSGGLADAHAFYGKDAILSGPAGGIVGMARTAALGGQHEVIGFDMGGTSTDVSHFAGTFEREFETAGGGRAMRAPMMSIQHGGGRRRFAAGIRWRSLSGRAPKRRGQSRPRMLSARRAPGGDRCQRAQWARSCRDFFRACSGRAPTCRSTRIVVSAKFDALAARIGRPAEAVAEGFIAIAVQLMANAIKKISVARGYDVTRYTLQCFGGAGGQHACLVADALGMTRVFVHPLAGVLSAYGMGLADQSAMREQAVELPLAEDALADVDARLTALAHAACAELERQEDGQRRDRRTPARSRALRRTDSALVVPFGSLRDIASAFERRTGSASRS